MNMARTMAAADASWFDVDQYGNLDNPDAHFKTLGPEIWNQTQGTVTHFVAGGSTGGTISGTGKFLKGQNPDVRCVLADPYGSIFTDYFKTRTHGSPEKFLVEGVGKGSIPGAMNFDVGLSNVLNVYYGSNDPTLFQVIDSVIQVKDEDAFQTCHELAKKEGLMVGGSAGLNVFAALELANSLKVRMVPFFSS